MNQPPNQPDAPTPSATNTPDAPDASAASAASPTPGATTRVYRSPLHRFWVEWARPMLIVLLTLTGFRSTVADWNDVPTGSMEPTILPGDRIAVNKLAYDLKIPFTNRPLFPAWGDPSRGDVVVFFEPESGMRMVKRVVAIPGDRIEVRARRLIINGNPVQYNRDGDPGKFEQTEQIIENLPGKQHRIQLRPFQPSYADFGPITLPEDQYFVMGDNRDNSRDSRAFGQIPRHAIVGRAFGVALSFGERGVLSPRWGRFFSPIH